MGRLCRPCRAWSRHGVNRASKSRRRRSRAVRTLRRARAQSSQRSRQLSRKPLLPVTREAALVAWLWAGFIASLILFRPWDMLHSNPDLAGRPTISTVGRIAAGCYGSARKTAACISWVTYYDQSDRRHTTQVVLGFVDKPPMVSMVYDRDDPSVAAPAGRANAGWILRLVEVMLDVAVSVLGSVVVAPLGALIAKALRLPKRDEPTTP